MFILFNSGDLVELGLDLVWDVYRWFAQGIASFDSITITSSGVECIYHK